jgi:death-on-curing protein
MSKTGKRQQELESALAQAQQELTAARHELTERTTSIQELTTKAEDLTSRLTDLEEELERRPPALAIEHADGDDPEAVLEGELRSSMEREAQLARRIAELEALRVMATVDEDAALPMERARELDERIQALELQLEAARSREDALAARTVHANAVLADVGQRLAELGEQADRAERLDDDLARVTQEAAAAKASAEDASDRLRTLEAEHVATLERADETERRAADAERRFAALEAELMTASAVLRNLEEIYRVIRGRVDADPAAGSALSTSPLPRRASAPAGGFLVLDDEEPGFHYLTSSDLVATATRAMGSVVPGNGALLEEIASLPAVKSEGVPLYPGLHVKAAVLLAELAQRRPFERGNERIALAAIQTFFEINGYTVVGGDEELNELAALVSGGQLPLLGIAAALESATARSPAPGGATSIEGVKFAPGLPMNLE